MELGLQDRTTRATRFTGGKALIGRIDEFIAQCAAGGPGRYLVVEAEAGMGKNALATYLAFTRGAEPAYRFGASRRNQRCERQGEQALGYLPTRRDRSARNRHVTRSLAHMKLQIGMNNL